MFGVMTVESDARLQMRVRVRASGTRVGQLLQGCIAAAALAQLSAAAVASEVGGSEAGSPDVGVRAATPDMPGRVGYDALYFAQYSVNNAEDMIRLVPGGAAVLDATLNTTMQRGFGSAGTTVLINGRRFPGKSNEVAANLRRISPGSVERIELISGAAHGITTQSGDNLVNVVLKESAASVSGGNYEVNARFNDHGRLEPDGLIAWSSSRDGLSYKAGIERHAWSLAWLAGNRWSDRTRDEIYFFSNGALQESRPQEHARTHKKWIYTGGLQYDTRSGSRLELNGFYQTLHIAEDYDIHFSRTLASGAPGIAGEERQTTRWLGQGITEVSVEYQAAVRGGELEVLGIYHRENTPTQLTRDQTISGLPLEISRSRSLVRVGEDILRTTYTLPVGARRSLEIGAEMAHNRFDQTLAVQFDLDGDGRVEPVFLPTAAAHVDESRAEAFATLRWSGGGRALFEGGLTYERSSIRTNYSFYPQRTLGYWKPRLDLRIRGWRTGQFRILAERTVSQLDFNNFVPKFNVVDSRIDAGNAGLLPERNWAYEAGYQQRFAEDSGLLELRAYYNDITGRIEKVPLRDAFGLYGALGNIAVARSHGAEMKASLRLKSIGLRNTLLTLRYQWQQSAVRDPFTNQYRRIATDRGNNFDVGARQDWVKLRASAGFTYRDGGGPTVSNDLLVTTRLDIHPLIELFLEKKLTRSVTLRFEAQNVGGAREVQKRTLYAINAIDGTVSRRDRYDELRDMRMALRLLGQF
ncbi:MAG: outer membrane beta-barrel protein [Gammaproteobacteria bacterium]|nr:outer membrane beta-barrel protein [Gammaproteobacteria bacterium]